MNSMHLMMYMETRVQLSHPNTSTSNTSVHLKVTCLTKLVKLKNLISVRVWFRERIWGGYATTPCNASSKLFYYSTIAPFYHIIIKIKRTRKILNPLFDGLTYNTRRHCAHCSYFSSPLQGSEKYHATRKISAPFIC